MSRLHSSLGTPVMTSKVLPTVIRMFGDARVSQPPDLDVERVRDVILQEWHEKRDLHHLSHSDLRWMPWVCFVSGRESSRPLADDAALSREIVATIREHRRRSLLSALVHAFLRDYPTELKTFEYWRQEVQQLIHRASSSRFNLWRSRDEKFGLFENVGPQQTAQYLFDENGTPSDKLVDLGFEGELGAGRFCEESWILLWSLLEEQMRGESVKVGHLKRVLQLSLSGEKLRFGHRKSDLAKALLLPFAKRRPAPPIGRVIQEFLVKQIGDPRISRSSWNGIDRRALEIFRQWLVGLTLRDFFSLIDKTAYRYHWKYRKPFWEAYFREGLLSDAWVVLGRNPATQAEMGELSDMKHYGRIHSGGLADHSVLLLRIGTAVIAERSHTGMCRVWLARNKSAPEFGLKEYSNYRLMRGADEEFVHHGSEYGTWQGRISHYLHSQLGVRPPAYEVP